MEQFGIDESEVMPVAGGRGTGRVGLGNGGGVGFWIRQVCLSYFDLV